MPAGGVRSGRRAPERGGNRKKKDAAGEHGRKKRPEQRPAYPIFQDCLRGKKEKNGMGSCYFIAFHKEFMLKIVTKPGPSCKILW